MSYGPINAPPGMRCGDEEYESPPLGYTPQPRRYWYCLLCPDKDRWKRHSELLSDAAKNPPRPRFPDCPDGGLVCDACIAKTKERHEAT